MPYKLRNNRRHKFEKIKFKITIWPQYNKDLKERAQLYFGYRQKLLKHGTQKSASKNYGVGSKRACFHEQFARAITKKMSAF